MRRISPHDTASEQDTAMKITYMVLSAYRRVCLGKLKIIFILASLLVFLLCTVFVIPFRNVVFYPALQYAWRDIPTASLLRIHYSQDVIPDGVFRKIVCSEFILPTKSKNNISAARILSYSILEKSGTLMDIITERHGNFLPVLNVTQKIDHLYLYSVLVDALNSVNVDHFLVAGSLLGLVRHGGFVPWDDDIDISVSYSQWELVKQTLACIRGFTLNVSHYLHWKFHYTESDYPFIDIFFYQMDHTYVWSLTYYIRRTYIYPTKYVFPLRTGIFEGIRVPIPNDALSIVKRIYDYDTCNVYQGHIEARNRSLMQEYPSGFTVHRVQCHELSYIYNMSHLDES